MISSFQEDRIFPTSLTPDTCFKHDKNDSGALNSAHHGQFQEKTTTTDRTFSFRKLFPTENNNDR